MHVAVLGGGAMGTLFGARLALAGTDVTVVDRSPDHVRALRAGATLVEPDGSRVEVPVPATTDPGVVAGLLFVCVKSYDTAAAVRAAAPDAGTTVLTLQNGLGNAETIADLVAGRVLAGTTAHGATLEGTGVVRHAGVGPTRLGAYEGENDATVERVAALLSDAGFETDVVTNVRDAVWEKALVNVGINAATALARVPNGRLAESAAGRRLVERSVSEARRVARAEGRSVPADAVERALSVAEATASNVSSMRADVERGSRTEVESLNGAVVARARCHGLAAPVNRTLADLVRLVAPHSSTSSASSGSKSVTDASDGSGGTPSDDASGSDDRGQP